VDLVETAKRAAREFDALPEWAKEALRLNTAKSSECVVALRARLSESADIPEEWSNGILKSFPVILIGTSGTTKTGDTSTCL
jgi:hypothetical protein